jgi:hypothetical protein
MPVDYLDPRAEPGVPESPYELRCDLANERPITVGLLANGFPDSVNFLGHVERALAERLPNAAFKHWNKGNASVVASDSMLDGIASECHAVVAAYGH